MKVRPFKADSLTPGGFDMSVLQKFGNMDKNDAVLARYSEGAKRRVDALCCPVQYDKRYLLIIPDEVLERDYGCGDPTPHVSEGDTVLDLGCGSGKIAYIASQMVGCHGSVIGVDLNSEMLSLARRHQRQVAERLGYDNVSFRRGSIQDLALDMDIVDKHLQQNPVGSADEVLKFNQYCSNLRKSTPLIKSGSIDVVLSNCVLNLVNDCEKRQLFQEIYRVTRNGGKVAISDIVSSRPVPDSLKSDDELWSGCISGALDEMAFIRAFEEAGFYGVTIMKRASTPWKIIQGIEFRSITVVAFKGKDGPCIEGGRTVIYRGPFKKVIDDDNHELVRGSLTSVCDKTYNIYSKPPYSEHFVLISSRNASLEALANHRDERSHDREPEIDKNSSCCGTTCC